MRRLPIIRGNASARPYVAVNLRLLACQPSNYTATVSQRHASTQTHKSTPFKTPPRTITRAPQPDKVPDATYAPAVTSEGLEEVGGLQNWWEKAENWHQSPVFEPFANKSVVAPEELPSLVEQAVREALVVRHVKKQEGLMQTWEVYMDGEMRHALMGQDMVQIMPNGKSRFPAQREKLKALVEVLLGNADETDVQEVAGSRETVAPGTTDSKPTPSDAWKAISLSDSLFRFAVLKRVQQLTGHGVPDHKQIDMRTAGDLYACVAERPKPKKLADELLRDDGEFKTLSNVKVYPRRVTPIDREKMVGRWKVIVDELKKRDLPVIGTSGYGGKVERRWIEGKVKV